MGSHHFTGAEPEKFSIQTASINHPHLLPAATLPCPCTQTPVHTYTYTHTHKYFCLLRPLNSLLCSSRSTRTVHRFYYDNVSDSILRATSHVGWMLMKSPLENIYCDRTRISESCFLHWDKMWPILSGLNSEWLFKSACIIKNPLSSKTFPFDSPLWQ